MKYSDVYVTFFIFFWCMRYLYESFSDLINMHEYRMVSLAEGSRIAFIHFSIITLQKDLRWWHVKIAGLLGLDTVIVQCIYEAFKEMH